MRHSVGFVIGAVLAPALMYASGWGLATALTSSYDAQAQVVTQPDHLYSGLVVMLAAGLVIGVVMARRLSPFLSLLPGLTMLAFTALYILAAKSSQDLLHNLPPGGEVDAGINYLTRSGVFALLGLALVLAALVPSHWRSQQTTGVIEEEYF